jgi:hypothetical protein
MMSQMKILSDDELIAELNGRRKAGQQLCADSPHFKADFAPLSKASVVKAEKRLGFQLPTLLRRLYTEVANGGFGYSYGLLGLSGGMLNEDDNDAVSQYLMYRKPDPDDPYWQWPSSLLPAMHLGCAMYHCIQCDSNAAAVTWFEPNPHCDGETWDTSFIPFAPTLAEYLSVWLSGSDVFDYFGQNL